MLRVGLRALMVLVTGLLVTVLGVGVAVACSCAQGGLEEHVEWATVVARVHVDEVDRPASEFSGALVVYHVTASRLWKGEVPKRFSFVSAQHGASCGLEGVTEGQDLLLFALAGDGAPGRDAEALTANLCGGTTVASEGLIAQLTGLVGEGTVPVDTGEEPRNESAWPGWGMPAIVAAVVAAGAAVFLVRRRAA